MQFITTTLRALALSGCCGAAAAQVSGPETGPYLSLAAGAAHRHAASGNEFNPALQSQGLTVRSTAVGDHDSAWQLLGGYRFSRHLAVEAGYSALGRYVDQGQVVQDPGTVETTFRASSWNVSLLGLLPLAESFELFGKLGADAWHAQLDTQGRFSGRSAQPAGARGVGPLLGLGGRWRWSKAFSARIEWTRFAHIGDAARTGRSDIDLATLGLQVAF